MHLMLSTFLIRFFTIGPVFSVVLLLLSFLVLLLVLVLVILVLVLSWVVSTVVASAPRRGLIVGASLLVAFLLLFAGVIFGNRVVFTSFS